MTALSDDEIMELAGSWFYTGENQKRDDGYYYRSLGTPSNVRGSDLIEFARALLAEQARTQTHKAEDAPTLLEAFKSGKAILIDWPMEPVTPQEALKLMDMMDAEYAKTMGKPAPDREMAVCMQRVQHMACDLWASQKEVIRAHFVELDAAQSSTVAEDAPSDAELLDSRGNIRSDLKSSAYCVGNEYKPFHPRASHVRPEWRDGWNACFVAAIAQERKA